MINQIKLPSKCLFVVQALNQAGYDCFLVGGAVRDILQADPDADDSWLYDIDYDFTTNAKPSEIQAIFPGSFYENEFGTVSFEAWVNEPKSGTVAQKTNSNQLVTAANISKVHISLGTNAINQQPAKPTTNFFEITTYRSQEVYEGNHRKPTSMQWGESIEEDLARRDFTINAMAIKFNARFVENAKKVSSLKILTVPNTEFEIIDLYLGQTDLAKKLVKTVGDASTRFTEDALRMLRAIRFSVQLNFQIDTKTLQAIKQHHELLAHISGERIRDEFMKMLKSNHPKKAIELMDQTNVLKYVLPELLLCKGVLQGGHHTTDVWVHSLDALATCPSKDPIVRLATLIHDIAKPQTFAQKNGQITFYNHEVLGAHMAKTIARRLRLSKDEVDRIFILVRNHMFYYQPENTDAAIRRFMRKVGLTNVDDILALREGDRLGSGAKKTSWRLEEMKQRMLDQLNQPMEVRDLAINGHDLMTQFNLKPGPILGIILNQLLEEVLTNPQLNTKEQLMTQAHLLLRQFRMSSQTTTNGVATNEDE